MKDLNETITIDEALGKLEKMKEALEKQKLEQGEVIDIEPERVEEEPGKTEQVFVSIQAFMTSNGPKVTINGNVIFADGLLEYIKEYCRLAMRQHIIDNLPKEEELKK
jgi:hypothetical protein